MSPTATSPATGPTKAPPCKKGKRKKAKDSKNEFLDDAEYPADMLMGDNPYNMDQEKDDLMQTSSNDGDFEPGNSNDDVS